MVAKLNKVFEYLINIMIFIVTICLIFAAYSFIQLKVLNKDYVNVFGYTYFEIISGSMENEININDYVFVKLTDAVKKNDVISFYYNEDIVTHRIVQIDGEKIITKGDANNIIDNPITKEAVIGEVVFIGKGLGKIIKIITEPIVFISFFVSVLLFSFAFSDDNTERSAKDEEKI